MSHYLEKYLKLLSSYYYLLSQTIILNIKSKLFTNYLSSVWLKTDFGIRKYFTCLHYKWYKSSEIAQVVGFFLKTLKVQNICY